MDNVVQAIFLAFAMFVLVIGLSTSAYLINKMNTAALAVVRANDKTSDYQTVSYDSSKLKSRSSLASGTTDNGFKKRTVSADTVISTLYRYYKENFAVEIYDEDGFNQLFDLSVETKINSQGSVKYEKTMDQDGNVSSVDISKKTILEDHLAEAYRANYNNINNKEYMWGAPWLGSAKDIEQRIDLYVSSKAGYIGNSFVSYKPGTGALAKRGFASMKDKNFSEQFIQYTFNGETYTDTNGEDVETLVESQHELKKILIIYRVIN